MQTISKIGSIYKFKVNDKHTYWSGQYYENGKQVVVTRKSKQEVEEIFYSRPRCIDCLMRVVNVLQHRKKTQEVRLYEDGDYKHKTESMSYAVYGNKYEVRISSEVVNGNKAIHEINAYGPKGRLVFTYRYKDHPIDPVDANGFQRVFRDLQEVMPCSK